MKSPQLNRKFGLLRRLLNKSLKNSLPNKLIIHKAILKPMCTYIVTGFSQARQHPTHPEFLI